MHTNNKVVVEVFDVETRLQKLGLSKAILIEALQMGLQERINCSELVPVTFPGQAQWAYTIEGLRIQLRPEGWAIDSHRNLPVTIAPDESFCIVVYTGDSDTGRLQGFPTNKASKGIKTQEAILRNNLTLELFPETLQTQQATAKDILKTWVLLYHLDASNPLHPVLRAELSYPSSFDQYSGKIMDWEERIILDEIDLSEDSIAIKPYDDEPEVALDVPVRRKTA